MLAVTALHADDLGSGRPAPARAVRSNGHAPTILLRCHSVRVLGEWNRNGMSSEEDSFVVVLETS